MPGFSNGTVYANNVDFSGSAKPTPQIVSDGQLLIGSTLSPHIKAGSITSGDSSINITVGSGTIDLKTTNPIPTLPVSAPNGGTGHANPSGSVFYFNSYGTDNIFIGSNSGNQTLTGTDSIGIGLNTLSSTTSGTGNFALGANTLSACQGGSSNVGVGIASLHNAVSTTGCTAIGHNTLNATTGSGSTAVGYQSLYQLGSGSQCTAIGYQAGSNYTTTEINNICIGYGVNGTVGESNVTRIGNGQTSCYIAGITGVTVSNALPVFLDSTTGQLGTGAASIVSTWTDVTGATQAISVGNGYFTNNAGGVTYTLPATASLGDIIVICGKLGLTTIAQNANQAIRVSSAISTIGVTGSVAGTNVGDCITLRCSTAGASTIWVSESFVGSFTVT
jgi:hypothetical protein